MVLHVQTTKQKGDVQRLQAFMQVKYTLQPLPFALEIDNVDHSTAIRYLRSVSYRLIYWQWLNAVPSNELSALSNLNLNSLSSGGQVAMEK